MNILTVEDDKFFQKFYATKLAEQGHHVDIAANGEEGLDRAQNNNYDLILLDLIMPKKDGFEFLKEFSSFGKRTPILIFSTLGQEEDIEKAKQLGATDYINKSFFDFPALLQKIRSITSGRT